MHSPELHSRQGTLAGLGPAERVREVGGFDRPVLVHDYPRDVKAFYMKENPADPRTVLCNDMLAPEGYGEIIGGSQREDDLERLLRHLGSVPQAGARRPRRLEPLGARTGQQSGL